MPRVLVTGFEPFGGETVNPSALVALRLAAGGLAGIDVSALVLPVVRYRCVELAIAQIERERPDLVLMLGQAGGRARLCPERVAINVDDFRMTDNAGNQPEDEPIVPGGPTAFLSGLPVKAMVRRIVAAGIPAEVSNSAGVFLCNHLSYGVLYHIAVRRLPVRAGFLHVPYLPEQATRRPGSVPSMALETMLAGVHAGIQVAVEEMAALPVP